MRLAPDLFFAQAFPALLDSCEGDNSSKQSKHCASTYYQKVTFPAFHQYLTLLSSSIRKDRESY